MTWSPAARVTRERSSRSLVTTTSRSGPLARSSTAVTNASSPLPVARTVATVSGSFTSRACPSTTTLRDETTPLMSSSGKVLAISRARDAPSRTAAPARSFHQPFGVAPTTLAASTTRVTGCRRTTGQVWPNPGCRGSSGTRSMGTHSSAADSSFGTVSSRVSESP